MGAMTPHAPEDFTQTPPRLGNQYAEDRVLRSYLARALPPEVLSEIEPELASMGEIAGGELYAMQLADREHQLALVHLFHPSTDMYSCPLAMTDGAAKTLTFHDGEGRLAEAVVHLTSRDPEHCWTSGQWMTETAGGSSALALDRPEELAIPAGVRA